MIKKNILPDTSGKVEKSKGPVSMAISTVKNNIGKILLTVGISTGTIVFHDEIEKAVFKGGFHMGMEGTLKTGYELGVFSEEDFKQISVHDMVFGGADDLMLIGLRNGWLESSDMRRWTAQLLLSHGLYETTIFSIPDFIPYDFLSIEALNRVENSDIKDRIFEKITSKEYLVPQAWELLSNFQSGYLKEEDYKKLPILELASFEGGRRLLRFGIEKGRIDKNDSTGISIDRFQDTLQTYFESSQGKRDRLYNNILRSYNELLLDNTIAHDENTRIGSLTSELLELVPISPSSPRVQEEIIPKLQKELHKYRNKHFEYGLKSGELKNADGIQQLEGMIDFLEIEKKRTSDDSEKLEIQSVIRELQRMLNFIKEEQAIPRLGESLRTFQGELTTLFEKIIATSSREEARNLLILQLDEIQKKYREYRKQRQEFIHRTETELEQEGLLSQP